MELIENTRKMQFIFIAIFIMALGIAHICTGYILAGMGLFFGAFGWILADYYKKLNDWNVEDIDQIDPDKLDPELLKILSKRRSNDYS